MGLLEKLKSVLGMNGTGTRQRGAGSRGDVDVTVERDPSTGSEDAVKGTETGSGVGTTGGTDEEEWFDDDDDAAESIDEAESSASTDATTTAGDTGSPDAGGPDASESPSDDVGGEVDEETVGEEPEETGATETETAATEAEEPDDEESVTDAGTGETEEADEEPAQGSTDHVTEINGIGPAYGDRLEDAGVETVAELAAADAASLAEETDVAAGRVEGWVESANEY